MHPLWDGGEGPELREKDMILLAALGFAIHFALVLLIFTAIV
jgi:hypothetical protein